MRQAVLSGAVLWQEPAADGGGWEATLGDVCGAVAGACGDGCTHPTHARMRTLTRTRTFWIVMMV